MLGRDGAKADGLCGSDRGLGPLARAGDASSFAVDLKFRSMDDFRPEAVVEQVEPLRKLLEARTKLADLRNKLAGNDKLEDILNDVLNSTEKLAELGQQANARKE